MIHLYSQTTVYLLKYCNYNHAEGTTGANPIVFARLDIAWDLLCIIKKAVDSKGKRVISEAFDLIKIGK